MRHLASLLVLVSGIVLASGCDSSSGAGGNPVSGKVTYNGNPVSGAEVVFHSQAQGGQPSEHVFRATTDDSGEFTLVITNEAIGVPVGTYSVTVSKLTEATGPDAGAIPPDETSGLDQLVASGAIKSALPIKYAERDKTDLSVTIVEGENTTIVLPLTGK